MTSAESALQRRLRISGSLIAVGLLIEVATFAANPGAIPFLAFSGGALLVTAGMGLYLLSIAVSSGPAAPDPAQPPAPLGAEDTPPPARDPDSDSEHTSARADEAQSFYSPEASA